MTQKIVIIHYGMGNLRSVSKALQHVAPNSQVKITDDPVEIAAADRVVFPGQGAARDCMAAIKQRGLAEVILEAAHHKPFLGICMGLQVLLEFSAENNGTPLLAGFRGKVVRFNLETAEKHNELPLKIPHMGWNEVKQTQKHPLWHNIEDNSRFYFVHSYYVLPEEKSLIAGYTRYSVDFASVIANDHVFACQFHPEKSAKHGLQLLRNFVQWQVR